MITRYSLLANSMDHLLMLANADDGHYIHGVGLVGIFTIVGERRCLSWL